MMDKEDLEACFQTLAGESRELFLDQAVPVLDHVPTPLQFYRDWVTPNKPFIVKEAVKDWPAVHKWKHPYLRDKIGDHQVTVAVTPNGYADAVNGGKFIMPEERSMTFNKFLDILGTEDTPGCLTKDTPGVFYVQKQNSNFTDEFVDLMGDAATDVEWATEALGRSPDAVNFWIGDSRAVTSMHKDHYENIYCVIFGCKTFTLIPSTDQPYVPYGTYPAAVYKETSLGDFEVQDCPDTGEVPWIAIDPLNPDLAKYPTYAKARPVTCTVSAGDVLYLPSLWYHHVQQSHACIAVNYWYDMDYDVKYSYYKFVEELCHKRKS